MKNSRTNPIFIAVVLVGFLASVSQASAFPAVNFSGNTELSARYDTTVLSYQTQYRELGITSSRKISTLENRIALAYKNLAKAKTKAKRNLYEKLIVRSVKALDAELLRVKKTRKPAVATAPVTPTAPTTGVATPNVPKFVPEPTAWEGAAPADFLYYSDDSEGRGTSNGDTFRQAGFSAARCNVPYNTLLQLRSGDTGVIVKANDRPNCAKHPDIVDLTTTGFSTLAPISRGRLTGSVNALGTVPDDLAKEFLPREYFSEIGIRMDGNLPNIYLPNETLRISGQTTNGETETLIYLIAPSGKKISYGLDNAEGARFEYLYPLAEVGEYQFVVASGRSFSGVRSLRFTVLDPKVLDGKQFFGAAPTDSVTDVKTERREAGDLTAIHVVTIGNVPDTRFRSVSVEAGDKKVSRTGMGKIAFLPNEFRGFENGQLANVTVTARKSSTAYSHDTYTVSSQPFSKQMKLVPLYAPEHHIAFRSWVADGKVHFVLDEESSQKILASVEIITPSGKVDQVAFGADHVGSANKLSTAKGASFSYPLTDDGVYLVEVNYDTGFAAIIEPVLHGDVLAILPNEYDFSNRAIETDATRASNQVFDSINAVRKQAGLPALQLDPTLSRLAQIKAQDMSDNDYVGHVDSEGVYIRDTGKRVGIDIAQSIGENVAGGTVSASFLQAGLSLSSGHRANMLGDWSKVGIGVVIS
jgi:rare lipoprotein A (peptidoglycan hydrolase)